MKELRIKLDSNVFEARTEIMGEKLVISGSEWRGGEEFRIIEYVAFKIDVGTKAFLQCEVYTKMNTYQLSEFCKTIERRFKINTESNTKYVNSEGEEMRLCLEDVLWAAQSVFGRKRCDVFVKEGEEPFETRCSILGYAQFIPRPLQVMDRTIICRNTEEEGMIPTPRIIWPGTRADQAFDD